MSKQPTVVAGLGRPETPQETADRKAESSHVYRSSQTFRNLIAALIVTVAVVVIVVFAVPRGERVPAPEIDVAAIAADVETSMQRPALVPDADDFWRVNAAALEGGAVTVWNVTLAPAADDERGFVRVAQAFNADVAWAPQVLGGKAPTGTITIDGREWDEFKIGKATDANVSYAIGTQAGPDYVLLYGSRSAESTAELADSLSAQLDDLEEAE
ncbi:DUF4245 family protein [Microbacterium sp. H1-D42]|uniref:DUF4245 family protein n=1 Tax=Microbacterium sp. H1-D42 TaxID=2925844 RepID=UPI001F534385|nr:DUF4245 family protein [Microbacterium sp. H1-D42]UNK69873.1 DUF4245 domain-containing protein [Microbacterium sp. H1-D42]